ncbi:hypothetical protein BH09VER1_BH09VER1_39550 [soil metagenome]
MRSPSLRSVLASVVLVCALHPVQAEDILFIGNSYTYGGAEVSIAKFGGIPKVVEAIAKSKGHTANTMMLVSGGKDWGYHLAQPATDKALPEKPWDWVVLQDYSVKSTHVGNIEEFRKNGEAFYLRIRSASPKAKILLYATWARGKGNAMFTGTSSPKSFADPAEMFAEIRKAYVDLQATLEALEPAPNQIALAPVGTAFELSLARYPEINLYAKDLHHPSPAGCYLSGLVIEAVLFGDNPEGATNVLPGTTIDAEVAKKLQGIAAQAVEELRKP